MSASSDQFSPQRLCYHIRVFYIHWLIVLLVIPLVLVFISSSQHPQTSTTGWVQKRVISILWIATFRIPNSGFLRNSKPHFFFYFFLFQYRYLELESVTLNQTSRFINCLRAWASHCCICLHILAIVVCIYFLKQVFLPNSGRYLNRQSP